MQSELNFSANTVADVGGGSMNAKTAPTPAASSANLITLRLNRSNSWRGLYFEQGGQPATLEQAVEQGFLVGREDAPAAMTLLQNFLNTCDESSC